MQSNDSHGRFKMAKVRKKLAFYVDTECSFSSKGKCSYYSSETTQKQAGNNAKKVWGRNCCPIVYLQTEHQRFVAFCPTRGGAWGEQLPTLGGPSPKAVKVEVPALRDQPWAEVVEKAAKIACKMKS